MLTYTYYRKVKLSHYEIRIAIEVFNAKRIKEKNLGIDNTATLNLILRFLDLLES